MMQRALILFVFILTTSFQGIAQEPDTLVVVRQIDLRGETAETAVLSALKASKKQVVIIMVQNASPDLITQMENDIRGLIHIGYKRLVFVLGQGFTDDRRPTISIYSGGHIYALMKDITPNAQTSADLFKLVRDAYDESVVLGQ